MKLTKLALVAAFLFVFVYNAPAATLSESPGNIAQGGTVTATWSAIVSPTNRDWIGVYPLGAGDTAFSDWIYVNTCSRSGGASALANGSCPFLIPNSLPSGSYQLRLFANNGYARLATSNQFTVAPVAPPSTRFVDNGDGTVSDLQTGLMWEKKTPCTAPSATDIHCMQNGYVWSQFTNGPDGSLYTDFLARINAVFSTSADGITVKDVCFATYCDWRVPNIAELRTIVDCTKSKCLDPIFGPTLAFEHWSSTSDVYPSDNLVWIVDFSNGSVQRYSKGTFWTARAVRSGS